MNIICVDDEPMLLEEIKYQLKKQPEVDCVAAFLEPDEALNWAKAHQPDAAFLDINIGRMNGLLLAKSLREVCQQCAIVFLTGYSEYAVKAFEMHAEGYIMKPAASEDIRRELDYLSSKHIIAPPPRTAGRIYFQCFGNFEVFANGAPVHFERSKTKELLAYLVDRQGAATTIGELIAILWEDAPNSLSTRSNLRNLISDLKKTLADIGAEKVLAKERNSLSINCSLVDCDFYDFLQGMPYAVNMYRGEYMSQYSWAEITVGSLDDDANM